MRRRHKKPRGFESVRQHFGCDGTGLVMVGDRYLTDVTFGNLHGMLTVHTEQLTTVGDNRVVRLQTEDPRMSKIVIHNGVVYTSGQTAGDAGDCVKLQVRACA